MERRSFLTLLGVGSYGGLAWLVNACSSEGAVGAPTVSSAAPTATGPSSSNVVTGPKGPPTDNDEFVPGKGDGGTVVDNTSALPNASWEARVKQLEAGGIVYTEAAPGPWVGKERSHVPTMVADTMLANRVTILVNHVMQVAGPAPATDAGGTMDGAGGGMGDGGGMTADGGDGGITADAATGPVLLPLHYVTTIYVKTDTGVVAGLIEFAATDPAPPSVTFVLPPGTKTATAYENCNIHGLWASKPLTMKA